MTLHVFMHLLGCACLSGGFGVSVWTIADSVLGHRAQIVAALRGVEA